MVAKMVLIFPWAWLSIPFHGNLWIMSISIPTGEFFFPWFHIHVDIYLVDPTKCGCYGPPSQCNLLQIQGAQPPKSRTCHLQLLRLPRVFLLPQFRGVICMGLPMQHTCSTHATHMQHEHFPCKFPSKVAAGAKMDTFHSKTGVGAANVKSGRRPRARVLAGGLRW